MAHQETNHGDDNTHSPVVDAHYRNSDALKVEVAAAGDVDKEHKEYDALAGPKTKKFFCWRLTKPKWIGAIIGSVIVALALLIIILWFGVAVPLFQNNADKVHITLNNLDIMSVAKGDDVRTLGVNMSLHLEHNLHVHAKTDATQAALLFDGEAFAYVNLPALDLKTGKQSWDLVISGDADVTNAGVFEKMATALVTSKSITVDASARLTAHAFGLSKSGLKFDRSLDVTAINNFVNPPTKINKMTVLSCDSGTIQIEINATVTNPALVGLNGIGAVNMSLYFGSDYLGYAVSALPDLGIPRGASEQLFDLVMENSTTHLPIVSKMIKGIALGASQFWLTGDNAYSTQVGLLKKPLKDLNMSIYSNSSLLTVVTQNAKFTECKLISLLTS